MRDSSGNENNYFDPLRHNWEDPRSKSKILEQFPNLSQRDSSDFKHKINLINNPKQRFDNAFEYLSGL